MAGKLKTIYICNQCGFESSKWNGKCQSCGEWNTFEEEIIEISNTPKNKKDSFSPVADLS